MLSKSLELRHRFLSRDTSIDYWESEEVLTEYDKTLGQRTRWKWENVLSDLKSVGAFPIEKSIRVIDWGCGTGVASTAFFGHYPGNATLQLVDRSFRAVAFSARKFESIPNVQLDLGAPQWEGSWVLLSHVVSELRANHILALEAALPKTLGLIWIEPGERLSSQRLSQMRNRLLTTHRVLAPCPHGEICPLAQGRDWCHFFGKVTSHEAFQNGGWKRAASELGIDLRSLPISYLAMKRRSHAPDLNTSNVSHGRLIGRAQIRARHARFRVCDRDGVWLRIATASKNPSLLRRLKNSAFRHEI